VGPGEPRLQLSPVGSGQQPEPEAVRLRQAAVQPGQPSPGAPARRRGGGEGAAPFGVAGVPRVRAVLQGRRRAARREPAPLGQHGIARVEVVGKTILKKKPLLSHVVYSEVPEESIVRPRPGGGPAVCRVSVLSAGGRNGSRFHSEERAERPSALQRAD